jgi:hypothetical protein
MNLVKGEFFPSIADKILYHYDNLMCDPNDIENGDIVYCDTHYILKYKDILNTKNDLTIITHNSDHCLYDGEENNYNGVNVDELTCYSKWFGQNSYSKKVIPLPIGFENTRWEGSYGPKNEWLNQSRKKNTYPSSLVYLNCNKSTNCIDRSDCYDKVSKMSFVVIDEPNLPYPEYLNKIKDHMFVISPRGNGLDCHRTWEVLMMRRIPILKREGQLEELYKNFPVLFIDSWDDIDNINFEKIFKEFSFDNQEYLYFNFWEKMIYETLKK